MKTKKEIYDRLQQLRDQQVDVRDRFPHHEPKNDIEDMQIIVERLTLDVLNREIKILEWILRK